MGEEPDDGVIPDGIVPPYIQKRVRRRRRTLSRPCPVCQAKPGEPCTTPTDTGRRPIRGFHLARECDDEVIDDPPDEGLIP